MTKTRPSSVQLNGKDLHPAPFVSTSFEYNYSGSYIIGGFLIVNLDGTLVGDNILQRMEEIGSFQGFNGCVDLVIGCQGTPDFLSGSGKIRDVNLSSSSDQPFTATYNITIAIETIEGVPAVKPEPDFLTKYCLTEKQAKYISSFSETITLDGNADNIVLVDSVLGVSKSFVRANGKIQVSASTITVCGDPDFNGIDTAIAIIEQRANTLMNLQFCDTDYNKIFSSYRNYSKWIDSKSLEINDNGSVSWSFDLYLTQGSCSPFAWADINTDDNEDLQSGSGKTTRTISGTLRGICPYTGDGDLLSTHISHPDRMSNALAAWYKIKPSVQSGDWPSAPYTPIGENCKKPGEEESTPDPCASIDEEEFCYQRISSNVNISRVSGEVSFSAEFGSISNCQPQGVAAIDVTVEEDLPHVSHREFIVPNIGDSIIQYMGITPHKATVTVRGTLQGCDTAKIIAVTQCVDKQFGLKIKKYNGWLLTSSNTVISTYNYTRSMSFIKCK